MSEIPHVWCMRPPFTQNLDILKYFPLSPAALGQAMNDLSSVIVADCVWQLASFPASVPQEKLRVIESGLEIPLTLKNKDTARRELAERIDIPANSRIVLNVSRMSPEKDLATFVQMAKAVIDEQGSDVHFVHLGQPAPAEYAASIHKLVEELGLQAHFHHIDEIDRIFDVMRAADVFLFTSVNYEGLARVCAEAMLVEVPVVSTRCGGPEDYVIEGQTGYLTDVADVHALAARTSFLLSHPEEAQATGGRARQLIAAKYDVNRMNILWMDLFDELIAHPQPPAFNALTLELLVNTLTLLGETGAQTSQQDGRLRTLEGWLAPLKNNIAMRALRSVKALANKAAR
jgi:glycosyltransferase involved in cell wall biosynthesis